MQQLRDGSRAGLEQDEGGGSTSTAASRTLLHLHSETSVCDVPDELLQICFARIPVRFLHRVRAVCKRWYRLGQSNSLRQLRKDLGLTEPWTFVLANEYSKNCAFRGLQGHAYDLRSNACLSISPLEAPQRLQFGVIAGTNGLVYILGGRSPLISGSEFVVFARVDAYDLFQNCWSRAPAMRTARFGFASGAFADEATNHTQLIVSGGYDAHGQALSFAEIFDVQRQEWEQIPSMLQMRGACRGQVLNGMFYVKQANADPHYVERYDPINRQWACCVGEQVCFQERPAVSLDI